MFSRSYYSCSILAMLLLVEGCQALVQFDEGKLESSSGTTSMTGGSGTGGNTYMTSGAGGVAGTPNSGGTAGSGASSTGGTGGAGAGTGGNIAEPDPFATGNAVVTFDHSISLTFDLLQNMDPNVWDLA